MCFVVHFLEERSRVHLTLVLWVGL